MVASIEFSLDGYSVLNEEKCQGLVIPKDPTIAPLMVVMSNKKSFRQRKAEYYGVIINNANQSFEAERKKLQAQIDQLVENDQERRILLSKIAKLEAEKQDLEKRADALAEQFAEINLDAASQLAQDALALFKEGKVKAAIATLDDEVLDQNMREAQQNKANAEQKLMQADSAIQQGVENYMVKARLQKADRQWEAARDSYEKAILGDSINVDNLWEVANYVYQVNDQEQAIQYYKQALRHEENEVRKAGLFNNVGLAYKDGNDYPKAKKYLESALEIRERLAKGNPAHFEPDVANSQNNLGNLYYSIKQYAKAEQSYVSALEIYERLAKGNPARFEPDLAMTQNNLAILYFSLDRKEEVLELLGKTLPIYRKLAVENSARYDIEIARTLYLKGLMLVAVGKQSEANEALLEAKQIAKKYPQIPFSQNVIDAYKQYYKEESASNHPLITAITEYEQKVAATENPEEKVRYQAASVHLLDSLLLQNPSNQQIIHYTANQYGSLAWFYLFTKQFQEAEAAAQKALAMSDNTEWVNTNLALALLFQGKYKAAEAIYLRLKDKEYGEATYRETFLKDLEELEAAGVTHKKVKKVRKLLERN